MKKKAIIFDLDGTLIDSMQLWRQVDHDFLTQRGIAVPADLFDHLPLGNSFIQTAQYFKDRFSLSESVADIMSIWTSMVSEHYSRDIQLKPGVKETLSSLHEDGLLIGLGTSNSFELAKKSLSLNRVWDYFQAIVTGDMHLKGKPFPDIYLLCAEKLGVNPNECIVIEDTLSGIQAAINAGMTAIAIYDSDSQDHHPIIKSIAHCFCMTYTEVETEILKIRNEQ